MKLIRFLALGAVSLLAASLLAKDAAVYPSAAAKAHIGECATVTGKVSGVHVTSTGTTFINLGPAYPDNDLTIVVFADDADKFGDLDSLEGKTVSATGTIKEFHNKPEIVLKDPAALKQK